MDFDIPRNRILPVDCVEVRLDASPHPFELANEAAIEKNWLAEKAANPALFDGTVVLLSGLTYKAARLEGVCHAVRFATFMHWRKNRAVSAAEHAYAHAMLVSRDDALIAIRMGAHTVNAGRVYFAAGSFEPIDFVEGVADLHFNMVREVDEETGIDISHLVRGKRYHTLSTESGTVIFRRYYIDENADIIAEAIRDFVDGDPEPEIEGPVIIRGPDDRPEGLMPHMGPLIEWHFSVTE
jgi:8-oxo-dGTP pyrophosphatase MutT (NUDIX family)